MTIHPLIYRTLAEEMKLFTYKQKRRIDTLPSEEYNLVETSQGRLHGVAHGGWLACEL